MQRVEWLSVTNEPGVLFQPPANRRKRRDGCNMMPGIIALVLVIVQQLASLINNINTIKGSTVQVSGWFFERMKGQASKEFRLMLSLFIHENLPVIAAGVLINAIGFSLARQFQSILFLDMVGTALVCVSIGPWKGSLVAVISAVAIHPLLSPSVENAYATVVPWAIVSISGAIYWGYMCRRKSIRAYLQRRASCLRNHLTILFQLGVLGAIVMAAPGAILQTIISNDQTPFAFDPKADSTLLRTMKELGLVLPEAVLWWVINSIRYLPDKLFSIGLGIVLFKVMLPYLADRKKYKATGAVGAAKLNAAIPLFITLAALTHLSWQRLVADREADTLILGNYLSGAMATLYTVSFVSLLYSTFWLRLSREDFWRAARVEWNLRQASKRVKDLPGQESAKVLWPTLVLSTSLIVICTALISAEISALFIWRYIGAIYALSLLVYTVKTVAHQYAAVWPLNKTR